MTNPLAQDLGGVVRLLEKATPGKWAYSKRNDPEWPASIISGMDTGRAYAVAMCPRYRNSDWSGDANAIAAAVNFLRAHSAEIAGALRDAERLDWLIGNCAVLETNGYGDWRIKYHWTSPITYGPYADAPRSAIDYAMQQGGEGGEAEE